MRAIFKREIQGYFYTPAAYVFMGVFLLMSSIFFWVGNLATRSSNLNTLLQSLSYLWMLLSPVLTMRLIAGERHQKTDQMLFSSPCSFTQIVLGKYFAAVTVLLCTVICTFIYGAIIAFWGKLYLAEAAVGYLGLVLCGCSFLALDLFVSCFGKSQMTAVVLGFGANLLLWLADVVAAATTLPWLKKTLQFISLYQRYEPFAKGLLRFSNVLFNVAFCGIMLFLCVRVMDSRRWSEA